MPVLRIGVGPHSTVRLEFLQDDRPPFDITVPVPALALTSRDHSEIRWYLEDFREFPQDPAPLVAARCALRLRELGESLFTSLFTANAEAVALWEAVVRSGLDRLRVEVDAELGEAVPFELLRAPGEDTALAMSVRSFAYLQGQGEAVLGSDTGLRVLLVICRPDLDQDISFRSVAAHVLALADRYPHVSVEVLRPPTFTRLQEVLAAAAERGEPFHLVHFDGHGSFGGRRDEPPQGFVSFEDPAVLRNRRLVDGSSLGQVLAENGVPVLVLNACGSARAVPGGWAADSGAVDDEAMRTYGSLARNALGAGLNAVVAMRYNIYAKSAAAFVAAFYRSLLTEGDLGRAVARGRAALADLGPLQDDWLVPALYRRSPGPVCRVTDAPAAPAAATALVARDDVVILLERAFDRSPVVVLHGPVGIGKTTVAGDLADWFRRTAGVSGHVDRMTLTNPDARPAPGCELSVLDDAQVVADWPQDRRRHLADAVRATVAAGGKVLVIGRDEARWAGEAERIAARPLNQFELAELAERLAADPDPALLASSLGNPLALKVLLDPRTEIPELSQESLRARFGHEGLRVLGLLLFLRTNVSALHLARLAKRAGLAAPSYDDAGALLDRAVGMGLLRRLPGDFFEIHPLLARWLRPVLGAWPDPVQQERVQRAVVTEFADYSQGIFWSFNQGRTEVLALAAVEEDNLLLARELALQLGLKEVALSPMQALRSLYADRARTREWSRLVAGLTPALVSAETGLPGEDLDFTDPQSLNVLLDYLMEQAGADGDADRMTALALMYKGGNDGAARRTAAIWLSRSATSAEEFQAAADLANQAGDTAEEASVLVHWGHWTRRQRGPQAEQRATEIFRESLELAGDRYPREALRALDGLAVTFVQRADRLSEEHGLRLVKSADLPPGIITLPTSPEAAEAFQEALRYYEVILRAIGDDDNSGPTHHQYAGLCATMGDLENALSSYQKAIACHLRVGNQRYAANSQVDMALLLIRADRPQDAKLYLEEAIPRLRVLDPPAARRAESIMSGLAG